MDSQSKNRAFAEKLGLKFPLLSDQKKTVSRDYGVLMSVIKLAKRTTFLIDREGIIREVQTGGEALEPENALRYCRRQ